MLIGTQEEGTEMFLNFYSWFPAIYRQMQTALTEMFEPNIKIYVI